MALAISHNFVSPIADQGDPTLLGPNEWNDTHALAVAPINAVVFADSLTSLNGDADFTWLSGTGLTIGGATETLGVVTPGVGGEHVAIGNYGVIGSTVFAPGDPVNQTIFDEPAAVVINELFSGDLSLYSGGSGALALFPGFKHTGVSLAIVQAMDFEPTINSDSTGDIRYFAPFVLFPTNYGSGDITHYLPFWLSSTHQGSGIVSEYLAQKIDQNFSGSGTVGVLVGYTINSSIHAHVNSYAIGYDCNFNFNSSTYVPLVVGFWAEKPIGTPGTLTAFYGYYCDDMSGIGSSISENIHSEGATSLTKFEGHHYQGNYYETTEVTAPSAPPANGVRFYAQDDGTGVTQLMARFNTGPQVPIAQQEILNKQTGTTYIIAASDFGKIVTLNNAGAITLTLPNSLPQDFNCLFTQEGAGQVSVVTAASATMQSPGSLVSSSARYGLLSLFVFANGSGTAADWRLNGDLV